jgi:hypothetical protein
MYVADRRQLRGERMWTGADSYHMLNRESWADGFAWTACSDPEAHYLYGLELTTMNILLPILNDRSDNAVGIELFDGKRRLVPLSEEEGVGWRTRWKVKPAVGWPKGRPRKRRPADPAP